MSVFYHPPIRPCCKFTPTTLTMNNRHIAIFLMAFGLRAAYSQPGPQPIAYTRFTLDNGLILLVHEDHKLPEVAVNTWYHVGSGNELPGRSGFAHLFEHFFFNKSKHSPGGYREIMDDLGAYNRNGFTDFDRTAFMEEVPVGALERTLFLEADRMGFLDLSEDMLKREIGVVKNEKRQAESAPYSPIDRVVTLAMFPADHPYRGDGYGSMDDLEAATLADIDRWYKKYYGPNNAVLVLAGDVTPVKALELVKKYFGAIPPIPPVARSRKQLPALTHTIRVEAEDRVPSPLLEYNFFGPDWNDADYSKLLVLANILAGSMGSRLDQQLVQEKKLAVGDNVYFSFEKRELASLFRIDVYLKEGVAPLRAEKELDSILSALANQGPSGQELQRAVNRYRASFARELESLTNRDAIGGRSETLAQSLMLAGNADAYYAKFLQATRCTPADIKRLTRKWLLQPHCIAVVKPYTASNPSTVDIDRRKMPDLVPTPPIQLPAIQRAVLSNGMKLVLIQRDNLPIVNVTLTVNAGISSDPPARAGLSQLAMSLLSRGTTGHTADEITGQLDGMGANLSANNQLELSSLHLEILSDQLPASLKILSELARVPAFPAIEVSLAKGRQKEVIGYLQSDPRELVKRVTPGILFGKGHPYGMPQQGDGYKNTVDSITREDLVQWHSQWFTPGNTTVIVTGKARMAELKNLMETYFGGWRTTAPASAKDLPPPPAFTGTKIYLIDLPDAEQSVIVAAQVTARVEAPDKVALETAMLDFGGLATSRLNRNLRLDKHWAYLSEGGVRLARNAGSLIVTAPVQTDKTAPAMLEILKEVRDIAGQLPIAGEEFEGLMRSATQRLPARFSTLAPLDDLGLRTIAENLPVAYWAEYPDALAALTEQQVNAAAGKYIRPDALTWLIAGDLKKIREEIRALQLGEMVELDVMGERMK